MAFVQQSFRRLSNVHLMVIFNLFESLVTGDTLCGLFLIMLLYECNVCSKERFWVLFNRIPTHFVSG